VSISPTFKEQLLCMQIPNFLGSAHIKAAGKKVMKLATGVNFTTILRAAFSNESLLKSFNVLTVWVCNVMSKGNWHKGC